MNEVFSECPNCGGIYRTNIYNIHTLEESSICFSCGKRSSYIISRDNDININPKTGELIVEEDLYKEGYGLVAYEFVDLLNLKQIGVYAFNEEQTFQEVFEFIQYLKKNEPDKKVLYATLIKDDELYTVYGKTPMLYQKNIDRYIHVLGINPILEGISYSKYLSDYYSSSTTEDYNLYNYMYSKTKKASQEKNKNNKNNDSTITSTRNQLTKINEDICISTSCENNYCNHL